MRQVVEPLRSLPVVVGSGLRQSVKVTLLRNDPHLCGRRFLTFDDMKKPERVRHAPGALRDGDQPLTIDEA